MNDRHHHPLHARGQTVWAWEDDYYEGRSRGRRAYDYEGADLDDNPFDPSEQPHTHRGWRDGWFEARDREDDR